MAVHSSINITSQSLGIFIKIYPFYEETQLYIQYTSSLVAVPVLTKFVSAHPLTRVQKFGV
jgi:hypothetical protein